MAKTLTQARIARLLKRLDLYPEQLTREEKRELAFLKNEIPNSKKILEETKVIGNPINTTGR